jgi:hypothetical protein
MSFEFDPNENFKALEMREDSLAEFLVGPELGPQIDPRVKPMVVQVRTKAST